MVQIIDDPGRNFAARFGSNVGRALSEQVPKEVERYRLAQGLKQFEQDVASGNLSPMQQLARLSAIPGITPQMIQSFGELGKQQGQANALRGKAPPEGEPIPIPKSFQPGPGEEGGKPKPSVTTTQGVQATTKPYIPKTPQQLQQRAGELLRDDPALYQNDPNAALNAARAEDQQYQAINQAYQNQRTGEQNVLNTLRGELADQKMLLNADVPGNVFNEVQDKAIEAVTSGRLTEKQAAQEAAQELDKISRDYQAMDTIGDYSVFTRSPSANRDALKSLRTKFKERDDLENFADSMIAKNGLSAPKAYYTAYPVSDTKELNNAISKLPHLEKLSLKKGYPEIRQDTAEKTMGIAPKIAKAMGNEGSPLGIATELQGRGYDPAAWMNYLRQNRKALNLSERQGRELDKPADFTNTLNDLWMFAFSGLDKLLEQ